MTAELRLRKSLRALVKPIVSKVELRYLLDIEAAVMDGHGDPRGVATMWKELAEYLARNELPAWAHTCNAIAVALEKNS